MDGNRIEQVGGVETWYDINLMEMMKQKKEEQIFL